MSAMIDVLAARSLAIDEIARASQSIVASMSGEDGDGGEGLISAESKTLIESAIAGLETAIALLRTSCKPIGKNK